MVIASHYARPVCRHLQTSADLRDSPGLDGKVIANIPPGSQFELLDDTLGWAWGYAGDDRRVGYVESQAIGV